MIKKKIIVSVFWFVIMIMINGFILHISAKFGAGPYIKGALAAIGTLIWLLWFGRYYRENENKTDKKDGTEKPG